MNFSSFLIESLLMEGGAAIKGSSRVTQVEARHLIPDIIADVSKETGIPKENIKAVGSAGRKPKDDDLSGDIDIAIEASADLVKTTLPKLAYDGQSYKAMASINIYSFARKIHSKIVQVDLIPVQSADFAAWSYISDERDLSRGFKGAVRNEVMFAIAKYADLKKTKEGGETVEMDRYFFDLSRGLMRGKQTRRKPNGKLQKGFRTIEKEIVSNDPNEVVRIMFGDKYKPEDMRTFDEAWEAIHDENFPWKEHLNDIIEMTKTGIKSKKLQMPDVLL